MDDLESIITIHVSRSICGHDEIVHGGLLAALLDETLVRTVRNTHSAPKCYTSTYYTLPFPDLLLNRGYGQSQFGLPRSHPCGSIEVKGRRITIQGRVEDLEGKLFVEAKAIFVQPKFAHIVLSLVPMSALGARSTNINVNPEAGNQKPHEAAL